MPERRYYAWREPPRAIDRAYAHPGTLATSVTAVAVGSMLVVNVTLGFTGNITLHNLNGALTLWMGVALTVGGALAAFGLTHRWPALNRGWAVERTGWFLQAGAWLSLALSIAVQDPNATLTWPLMLTATATAALRLRALTLIERSARTLTARRDSREAPEAR